MRQRETPTERYTERNRQREKTDRRDTDTDSVSEISRLTVVRQSGRQRQTQLKTRTQTQTERQTERISGMKLNHALHIKNLSP